jgi:bacillithiol biosynthesis deacetylase BshB1
VSTNFDAMILAAHPDDAELCCGGTILKMLETGKRVAIVDMTRGEAGTLGNAESRANECAAATELLGVQERSNLALPDSRLQDDLQTRTLVVGAIRRLRPRLLFAPHTEDLHPDHAATGRVAREAFFCAGLAKFAPDQGTAFRPTQLISYPGNDHVTPSFCVDISAYEGQKRKVIECYVTQVNPRDSSHYAHKLEPLEWMTARNNYFGAQIGCRAAEPFVLQGPLAVTDLSALFPD